MLLTQHQSISYFIFILFYLSKLFQCAYNMWHVNMSVFIIIMLLLLYSLLLQIRVINKTFLYTIWREYYVQILKSSLLFMKLLNYVLLRSCHVSRWITVWHEIYRKCKLNFKYIQKTLCSKRRFQSSSPYLTDALLLSLHFLQMCQDVTEFYFMCEQVEFTDEILTTLKRKSINFILFLNVTRKFSEAYFKVI
jgi:hypothetical protein